MAESGKCLLVCVRITVESYIIGPAVWRRAMAEFLGSRKLLV